MSTLFVYNETKKNLATVCYTVGKCPGMKGITCNTTEHSHLVSHTANYRSEI